VSGVKFSNTGMEKSQILNADLSALSFQEAGLPMKVSPFNFLEAGFAGTLNTNFNVSANYLQQPEIISGVVFFVRGIGNFTPSDFNGVALYRKVGNLLLLVAESLNDATIFDTAGYRVVPFISSYNCPGNELLYAGLMHNRSAVVTAPVVGAHATLATSLINEPNNIPLFGQVAPSVSLPLSLDLTVDVLGQQIPRWLALV
jgi:hypothetical protein